MYETIEEVLTDLIDSRNYERRREAQDALGLSGSFELDGMYDFPAEGVEFLGKTLKLVDEDYTAIHEVDFYYIMQWDGRLFKLSGTYNSWDSHYWDGVTEVYAKTIEVKIYPSLASK